MEMFSRDEIWKLTSSCNTKLIVLLSLLISPSLAARVSSAPVKIIFETDFTFDVDDVGALATLHALVDEGEAELLGVSYNEVHEHGVAAIDAVNTWYGRGDLPIGAYNKDLPAADDSGYLGIVANEFPTDGGPSMSSLDMYRKVLAEQPDESVVISSVGFTNNLADLIRDPTGLQLVKDKVKLLVLMGSSRNDGFNFFRHETADEADYVLKNWPSRMVISYAGRSTCTGNGLLNTATKNPVRSAYVAATPWLAKERGVGNRCRNSDGKINQPSWDQIATLFAVRHETNKGRLFETRTDGEVNVRGHVPINYRAGQLEYVTASDATALRTEIERLMVQPRKGMANRAER